MSSLAYLFCFCACARWPFDQTPYIYSEHRLVQLHELEIAELNRLHAQEIQTMELTSGSGHRTGKGLFDLIEQSAALEQSHAKEAGVELSESIGAFIEPGKSNFNSSDADFLGYLGELQSKISLATKGGVVTGAGSRMVAGGKTAGGAAEEEKEGGAGGKRRQGSEEEDEGEAKEEGKGDGEETKKVITSLLAEDRKGADIFPGATSAAGASVLSLAAATPVRKGGASSSRGLIIATPDSLNEG